jgi:hypothetical protein
MAPTKQNRSKRRTIAVPVAGAVGASMAVAGGAYATGVVGSAPDTLLENNVPGPQINLTEEEIFDVSLGTFFVFDKEGDLAGEKYAQRGCRGGGGCAARGCAARGCGGGGCAARGCAARGCGGGCAARGCRGCRGCSVGGCRACIACAGCSGCSCGCCLSWGACQYIC